MKILKIIFNVFFLGTLAAGALLAAGMFLFKPEYPNQMFGYFSLLFILVPVNTFILVSLSLVYHSKYLLKKHKKIEHGLETMYKVIRPSVVGYGMVVVPMVINILIGHLFPLNLPEPLMILQVIILYFIFIGVYFSGKKHKHLEYMTAVGKFAVLAFCFIALGYFLLVIYSELMPRKYFTFDLKDPVGIYLVNYDGEYWLTYYIQEEQCDASSGVNICTTEIVKKGNAPIGESPIPLDSLLDKPVRVTGEFEATNGPRSGQEKKMCIAGTCSIGTGPGVWHSSPLKIKTIEQVEYFNN